MPVPEFKLLNDLIMEAIQNAEFDIQLRLVREVDLIGIDDTTCSICLTSFSIENEVVVTKCSHIFHFACIDKWFTKVM